MKKVCFCMFLCVFLVSCTLAPYTTNQESSVEVTPAAHETSDFTDEKPIAPTIFAGASTIAAGENFALAVTVDGSLWAWGDNYNGQLGDGTTETRYTPVKIMDSTVYVAAGRSHSLAIKFGLGGIILTVSLATEQQKTVFFL